jgi:hypothetical protein
MVSSPPGNARLSRENWLFYKSFSCSIYRTMALFLQASAMTSAVSIAAGLIL